MTCPPILDRLAGRHPVIAGRDGPRAPDRFTNDIGGLLPIALCSRTSLYSRRQASHFPTASSRLMNQWAFKHSARNLPLKLSMNALSVGLPGREKSSVTPFM